MWAYACAALSRLTSVAASQTTRSYRAACVDPCSKWVDRVQLKKDADGLVLTGPAGMGLLTERKIVFRVCSWSPCLALVFVVGCAWNRPYARMSQDACVSGPAQSVTGSCECRAEPFCQDARCKGPGYSVVSQMRHGDHGAYVTILSCPGRTDPVFDFLRSRGIAVDFDSAGFRSLRDSAELRAGLADYLSILCQRTDVISTNLSHICTASITGPVPEGEVALPYRRKILVVHEDGSTSVELDPSPFRLLWWPDDPMAIKDGKNKGYVRYPNVDEIVERIDLEIASREYEFVLAVLEKLYDAHASRRCAAGAVAPGD